MLKIRALYIATVPCEGCHFTSCLYQVKWITVTGLGRHLCETIPSQNLYFQPLLRPSLSAQSFVVRGDCFVYIGGTVDHQCVYFLFITFNKNKEKKKNIVMVKPICDV